jgi:hypothetical protein
MADHKSMSDSNVRRAPRRPTAPRPKVIGTMADGVKILMPRARPTHFTYEEIAETLRNMRKDGKLPPLTQQG